MMLSHNIFPLRAHHIGLRAVPWCLSIWFAPAIASTPLIRIKESSCCSSDPPFPLCLFMLFQDKRRVSFLLEHSTAVLTHGGMLTRAPFGWWRLAVSLLEQRWSPQPAQFYVHVKRAMRGESYQPVVHSEHGGNSENPSCVDIIPIVIKKSLLNCLAMVRRMHLNFLVLKSAVALHWPEQKKALGARD